MSSIMLCTNCDETVPYNNGFVSTTFGRYAICCTEQCKANYERRMMALATHRRALSLGHRAWNGC